MREAKDDWLDPVMLFQMPDWRLSTRLRDEWLAHRALCSPQVCGLRRHALQGAKLIGN